MKWFTHEKPVQSTDVLVQRGVLPVTDVLTEAPPGKGNEAYLLPKELASLHHQDILHYLFRQVFKGNYLAPISTAEGSRTLDAGTGTGRWAFEMAQAFPGMQVYGLDLTDPQSRAAHASVARPPKNYHFQPGNILKRLPFVDGCFAFVHQRLLFAEIPFVQWFAVMRELKRIAQPGGWIELVECGPVVLNPGNVTRQWLAWWEAEAKRSGLEPAQMVHLGELAQRAGLASSSYTVDLPLGSWAGPSGELLQQAILAYFDDLLSRVLRPGVGMPEWPARRAQLQNEWQVQHCQLRVFLVLAENAGT
jgi:ubiquinone/menaquinone biosynthesis C-methylase UbiE